MTTTTPSCRKDLIRKLLKGIETGDPEAATVVSEDRYVQHNPQTLHTSFYDLFRVDSGKIVEHWDTIEAVPPKSEWKNDNGKF